MKLSQAAGGAKYNRLVAGNVISLGSAGNAATYGNNVSVSNVNISAALTDMISVNVPAGELIILKQAAISLLNTTSNTLTIELEVDGVVVATASVSASTEASVQVLGHNSISGSTPPSAVLTDIEVRTNFKIRARKSLSTAATVNVNFAKCKA